MRSNVSRGGILLTCLLNIDEQITVLTFLTFLWLFYVQLTTFISRLSDILYIVEFQDMPQMYVILFKGGGGGLIA